MKYRKKPVTIDAIKWTGNNKFDMFRFMRFNYYIDENDDLIIETLEGNMKADIGDYIIKGVNGEFYPCKPDIFHKTYEKVKENEID